MFMHTKHISKLVLLSFTAFSAIATWAQDTTKRRTVDITSTFKPTLKEAAKINFNATPPTADTSRPRLQYNIPNQNLLFSYQPGTLKPLALQVDTMGKWNNESYVKAGFGMLKTPYLEAGISLGDGKTAGANLYARHISSQGRRRYQDFANTNVDVSAFNQFGKNMEWDGRIGLLQEKYYQYGFQPDTLDFAKDSLRIKYQTWRGRISFHNINPTTYGISYAPEMKVAVFSDGRNNSESNTYINLPLQKAVGRVFEADVAASADFTRYKPGKEPVVNNTIYALTPSILFKTPNAFVQAGIKPSWDNGVFQIFPNFIAELSTTNKAISLQLGWVGYFRKTSYQYVAGINPWVQAPEGLENTQVDERFAGIKGSVGDHLNYSAKVGLNRYMNQPLFINDTVSGKSFVVVNESKMNVLHVGGDVGYTVGDKFSWVTNFAINQYTNLKTYNKAYGLVPVEVRSNIRIQVMKDLYVKGDIYAFNGTWYRTKESSGKLPGAADLGAGAEFNITKNVKLWAQFNNILNKEYQRWNQYPVYGFNLMGGVIYSFAQNNK